MISLRVKIFAGATEQVKTMRFTGTMSVSEVCHEIKETHGVGGSDHGLFQAATKTGGKPRWLRPEKTLRFYDFQSGMEVEYKKKSRPLTVKLMDDTTKRILIDDSMNVNQITAVIGDKLSLSNPEEFSLKEVGKASWLKPTLSLTEQGLKQDAVVVLKKKFFFNDANVDTKDPVQLHLLFVQMKSAILCGDHPTTKDEAVKLAAMACQIQHGDYNPSKHTKGYLKLKEYLPPAFYKNKSLEKEIFTEHKKLIGMSDTNAKYRYVALCRSLKTYGITFFNVKIKKGKKGNKLEKILLGITRHAVLLMDPDSKAVREEEPISHLKRWAANPNNFTLDFGDYRDDYLICITSEGENISQIIAGYIDIILKTRRDAGVVIEEEDGEEATTEQVAPVRGTAFSTTTTSYTEGGNGMADARMGQYGGAGMMPGRISGGGMQGMLLGVNDMASALNAINAIVGQFSDPAMIAATNADGLTLDQWKRKLAENAAAVNATAAEIMRAAATGADPNAFAGDLGANLANLIAAAREAAAMAGDDVSLLDGAKAISEALAKVLQAANDLAENPGDPKAMEALRAAKLALQSATTYLNAAAAGRLADQPSQNLLAEAAKLVAASVSQLVAESSQVGKEKRSAAVLEKCRAAGVAGNRVMATATAVAPAILDPKCQNQVSATCSALAEANQALLAALAAAGADSTQMGGLRDAAKKVSDAIALLIATTQVAGKRGEEPQDFLTPLKTIQQNVETINVSARTNPGCIVPSTSNITDAANQLISSTKVIAVTADPARKADLLEAAKGLIGAVSAFGDHSRKAQANPRDAFTIQQLQSTAKAVEAAALGIIQAAGSDAMMDTVRYWGKVTAAVGAGLVAASTGAALRTDPATADELKKTATTTSDSIAGMVEGLRASMLAPNDEATNEQLLASARACAPQAAALVAVSKRSIAKINDMKKKQGLNTASDGTREALKMLVEAVKMAGTKGSSKDVQEALEQMDYIFNDLDAMLLAAESGSLKPMPGQSIDSALQLLTFAVNNLQDHIPPLEGGARTSPDAVGPPAKEIVAAIQQIASESRGVAACTADTAIKKAIINAANVLARAGSDAISAAMDLSHDPSNVDNDAVLDARVEELYNACFGLMNAAKGLNTKDLDAAQEALMAEATRIAPASGASGDFLKVASDLIDAAKGYQTAVTSITIKAENDTKGLVPATKMAQSTVPSFVELANTAAGICPLPECADRIASESRNMVVGGARVVEASKAVASSGSADSKAKLHAANKEVKDSLDRLIGAIGASQPGAKEIQEAMAQLQSLLQSFALDSPHASVAMPELQRACNDLGSATSHMVMCARTNPGDLGSHSKTASAALESIVGAARTAAEGAGTKSNVPPQVEGSVRKIVQELISLSPEPGSESSVSQAQAIDSSKVIAVEATNIVKNLQSIAGATEDPATRKNLILTTEDLANAAGELAGAARTGIDRAHIDRTRRAVADLLNAFVDDENAGEVLVAAARSLAEGTNKLVSAASLVSGNPRDASNQAKLSTTAKTIPGGIAAVLSAASGLSPGVKECEEAIEVSEAAIGDLEAAGIAVTFGQLESPEGKTHQECQAELVAHCKAVHSSVAYLASANPEHVSAGAKNVTKCLPPFVNAVKGAAATTSNKKTQNLLLESSKALSEAMLGLLNAAKERSLGSGSDADISVAQEGANTALTSLAESLKTGVGNMRLLEEAKRDISALSTQFDAPPASTDRSYASCKNEVKQGCQELVKQFTSMLESAKVNVDDLGALAKEVAELMPTMVDATLACSAAAGDPAAKEMLVSAGRKTVQATSRFIERSKAVANDSTNRDMQRNMQISFQKTTAEVSGLMDALFAGATGERECEDAAYRLGKLIGDLDAAALFAAAGQMDLEAITEGKNYAECQAELMNATANVKSAVAAFGDAVSAGNQDAMGKAAIAMASAGEKVAQYSKATGGLGGDKDIQQNLLDSAKAVSGSAQGFINHGKNALANKGDELAMEVVGNARDTVNAEVDDLVVLAERAAKESARGIMEIDKATAGINETINQYKTDGWKGNASATAEDVVMGARALATGTGELVAGVGSSQDELVKACQMTMEGAQKLLNNAKGGGATSPDPSIQKRLDAAAISSATTATTLLEACKAAGSTKSLAAQAKVSSAARECAESLHEVVRCANLLPGGGEFALEEDTGEDLEEMAEKELQACARVIEAAAATLMDAKKGYSVDDALAGVTEAIMEAARAIAVATATLVKAAHGAQKERVAKGRNPKTKHLYKKDPRWANGLISAAQSVAATTGNLIKSANSAASGNAEEEVLVASAKSVAAATAQLVSASQAKADDVHSSAQRSLKSAAKAVSAATAKLVEAAKAATTAQEGGMEAYEMSDSAKADFEKQIEILRLEKQLEQARRALGAQRKAAYRK